MFGGSYILSLLLHRLVLMTSVRAALKSRRSVILALWLFGALVVGAAASGAGSVRNEDSAPSPNPESGEPRDRLWFLPEGELFDPLLADPDWPRFSAEYQWRLGSDEFKRVGAVSFGESLALVRSRQYEWGEWEFGLHANMDAIFDMAEKSFDLSNEDYVFGLTWSVLTRGVTTQLRVYHLSSHLGDEYLIANNAFERNHVSLEAIDLLVSYEPFEWLRIYGGIGALINPNPSFDPMTTEFGVEVVSTMSFASGRLTPIAGMDIQINQQNDWIPDVAMIAGLRLAQPGNDVRRIEFVARYYNGRSPEGQFFREKIESLGLGFRLGF